LSLIAGSKRACASGFGQFVSADSQFIQADCSDVQRVEKRVTQTTPGESPSIQPSIQPSGNAPPTGAAEPSNQVRHEHQQANRDRTQ